MNKLLVIVDAQNDFISGALGSKEAQCAVDNIVDLVKNNHYDNVCCTYDVHSGDYFRTLEGKKLPIPHCVCGTKGAELNKKIEEVVYDNYTVIEVDKSTFGAYDLPEVLNDYDAVHYMEDAEIYVCGFCTDICVISNVLILKAAFPECEISVISDCCAGSTPEMHQKALDVMRSCHVNII